jgi:phosphoglycerol transferase MdoB-like AlkP superfamily enzyme
MWLLAFTFELALFHRPYFAAFNVLSFMALVTLVSNAKQASLSEPFVYQDFEYFTDAIRHPRLYLPFFGLGLALTLATSFAIVFYLGLQLETPLLIARNALEHIVTLSTLAGIGALLVYSASNRLIKTHYFTLNASQDTQKYGIVATGWRYRQLERAPIPVDLLMGSSLTTATREATARKPHFVAIQSESFFDVRRICPSLQADVLSHWDAVVRDSIASGRLTVAAWGANTVRTEFSFLSGTQPGDLGIHRFNPYRKLAKHGIVTIASLLKRQGYRTVCVHPYPASFYSRASVFPSLGFDEFIDIESFAAIDKSGPYVGDAAVAKKIIEQLDVAEQPTFVFAITMENHGPLHWEKVDTNEAGMLFTQPLPENCADLAVYTRHLKNASTMVCTLTEHLKTLNAPTWLCFYGDHVPIMPKVYEALGTPDGTTDYFIWGSRPTTGNTPSRANIDVSTLAAMLLRYGSSGSSVPD